MTEEPSWTILMLTPDWWDDTIANWAFGSNLAAELIGLALTFLFGTLVYRAWLKRQRTMPLALIRMRLERATRGIIHEASGRLGVGYWWEYDSWDHGWALAELLDRLPADDTDPSQELAKIPADEWLEVARKIVQEFADLETSIGLYSSVLAGQRHLFETYSLLDYRASPLKDYLQYLAAPRRDELPPAALPVLDRRLILAVSAAIKAAASVYIATNPPPAQARLARLHMAWRRLCAAFGRVAAPASGNPEDPPT